MSWLHCNKCGVQKSSSNTVKFFCGSCCHVLCDKCNKILKVCPIDKRPFNGVEINASMPQKMRIYFEDPDKLLTNYQKVVRFQCEQRDSIESFEFPNTEDIQKLKDEIALLTKYKERTIKSNEKYEKSIAQMKAYFKHLDRKESDQSVHSVSLNTTASTSAMSLNDSSLQEDSGVSMDSQSFYKPDGTL
ncbi:RING finger protein nenya-like isoform X1 [Episyrphus balteatus]|uniref:RING finger protein nenya-like isoform X1 n=1 Tax=Episyrphus balteatus TaxID=286459 RepID=UPI002484F37C|nr:RING finger protein nenya-like isoform X1 [Episyrphus balteatus]